MQFIIDSKLANYPFMRFKLMREARTIIIYHKITPGEYNLNQYLLQNYEADLRGVCLDLLKRTQWHRDRDGNLIVLFPKKEDDKLAALITYGNGQIKGSSILKDAFYRDINM